MNSELITVVKERVDLGYSDDTIKEELLKAGHEESVISEVISIARGTKEMPVSNIPSAELPSGLSLVKSGFTNTYSNCTFVFVLAVPLILISLLEYMSNTLWSQTSSVEILIGIGIFVLAIVYFLLLLSVLRIISFSSERKVAFEEAFTWARKNIFSFFLISVLSALVIMGGFMLLVIPGIIVSVYLYLTQYAFAREGLKGMSALLRSRDLIVGSWLAVAKRIIVVYAIIILAFMLVGIIGGTLAAFVPEGLVSDLIIEFIIQFLGAVVTIVGLYVSAELFENLSSKKPLQSGKYEKGRKTYTALAILSPFIIIGFIFLIGYFYSIGGSEYFDQDVVNIEDQSAKERALELRVKSPFKEGE